MDQKKIREDIDNVNKLAIPMQAHEDENGNIIVNELDVNSIINESFDGEKGILEIFKGVYTQAKKGSVPHAAFIMQWYFKNGEGEEPIKEFRILEEIVEMKS